MIRQIRQRMLRVEELRLQSLVWRHLVRVNKVTVTWLRSCAEHIVAETSWFRKFGPTISGSIFVKDASKCLQRPGRILESRRVKKSAADRTGIQPYRVVAVGDTIISEQGLVAIIGRDPQYHVCGAAHTFEEANKLVQHHHPDVLLIEPFLESRDAIRWIKDLAAEFPRIRILVVTRQSELTYAERALHAGASGYWMKNSSVQELMHAIETVLAGEIYASRAITAGVMRKFAGGRNLPPGLDVLSNREIAVFGLIAAKHGVGEIAKNSALAAKRSRVTANTSKRSSVIAMPKNSSAARASC